MNLQFAYGSLPKAMKLYEEDECQFDYYVIHSSWCDLFAATLALECQLAHAFASRIAQKKFLMNVTQYFFRKSNKENGHLHKTM